MKQMIFMIKCIIQIHAPQLRANKIDEMKMYIRYIYKHHRLDRVIIYSQTNNEQYNYYQSNGSRLNRCRIDKSNKQYRSIDASTVSTLSDK